MDNTERELRTLKAEYDSLSSEIDTMHSELRAVRDELTAGDELRASAEPSSDGLRGSERDSKLYELEQRGALWSGSPPKPWSREVLGVCAMCKHAHLTQSVTEKEEPVRNAEQERVDKILREAVGEVVVGVVDKAPSREMRDADRDPTVTCLVAHRELKLKVRWCASYQALEDEMDD